MSTHHGQAEITTPSGRAVVESNSFGGRFEFLDALRGTAAMLVVIEHVFETFYPAFAEWSLTHFRLGEFGVLVFFLVSGFIIPASLERRGSLKEFWIGRFFRLFPLYWCCLLALVVLNWFGAYRGFSDDYRSRLTVNTLVNLSMVQDFTGAPLAMGQSWTLAYEMAFYLIVSVLFVVGWHRRSVVFAAAGLGLSMIIGNHVKPSPLGEMTPGHWLLLLAMVGAGVAATVLSARHRGAKVVVLSALVVAAVMVGLFNRPEPTFQAAFFLGSMFFGTCIYRWTTGVITSRSLLLLTMLAFVAIVVAQLHDWSPWLSDTPQINGSFHLAEVLTYGGAYVAFFAALLLRDRSFPAVLRWLGRISYSLYLVHSIVLFAVPEITGHPMLTCIVDVVVTVLVSSLTYRLIEQPAIAAGRRLTRRPASTSVPGAPGGRA